MSRTGRPTKLTSEVKEKFLQAIKLGLHYDDCCDYSGISRTTFYDWKNRKEKKFLDFLDALKEAESTAKAKLIGDLQKDRSWQSKAWILERRWPDSWGRKEKLQVDSKSEIDVNINSIAEELRKLPKNELLKIARKAAGI